MRIRTSLPEGQTKQKGGDETLWYPPIGLMKLSTYHKDRGDEVKYVIGTDKALLADGPDFSLWDRVYISTLFTFDWGNTISTIEFYKKAVGNSVHKIYVGGIMATLMPQAIYDETGIYPIKGLLTSAEQIGLEDKTNINLLTPDYKILDPRLYAINETFYAYTTRGCENKCIWCGVPSIEPGFDPYIDIKPQIQEMRMRYGDLPKLKLMDNNVLVSKRLGDIVEDLLQLGYGREQYTKTSPKRLRLIDFNQGLDASHINDETLKLLSKLNIRPMRIAFDKLHEKDVYEQALRLAHQYGFTEFSNYMLYNCHDTPRDLYDRLIINIKLNEEWQSSKNKVRGAVYSYPMRFAPITPTRDESKNREYAASKPVEKYDYLKQAKWTKQFTRNIEVIKGAAHGAISPTPQLARRAIGATYEEFITNLYMPEELLRNRNKYEKKRYSNDKKREAGTGHIEKFRQFILKLLDKQNEKFVEFHNAVSQGSKPAIREYMNKCIDKKDKEVIEWLKFYIHTN